jgi:hypothetical protein
VKTQGVVSSQQKASNLSISLNLEYWENKKALHKLRREKSLLQLKKKSLETTDINDEEKKKLAAYHHKLLNETTEQKKSVAKATIQCLIMFKSAITYSRHMINNKAFRSNLSRDTRAFVNLIVDKVLSRDSDGPRNSNRQAEFKTGLCDFYDALELPLRPLCSNKRKPDQFQKI